MRLFSDGTWNRHCPGMVEGETMHAALTKAGVPASFVRIEGAGHDFSGADLKRATAAMMQWFERHLGSAK